ncbi:MAG: 2-amino-4-hydroxy-6-hydroxymethyldihydropteridine diphosphokinase [Bacteroidota bacterium]
MENVFLSLGSNMGDRQNHLDFAISSLAASGFQVLEVSPRYETEPWGFKAGQNFLNQVIRLKTEKPAEELMHTSKAIEQQAGRTKSSVGNYEPRPLDIDILFYGSEVIHSQHLIVPHPQLQFRRFVLVPLADIAPDFIHPETNKKVSVLLDECRDESAVWLYPEINT